MGQLSDFITPKRQLSVAQPAQSRIDILEKKH